MPGGAILLHVLLALAVVLAAARLLGGLFRRLGQAPVIGEVVVGILLGPSLLGRLAPGVSRFVFPESVAGPLAVLAEVGVLLFLFVVGVRLDLPRLLRSSRQVLAVAAGSTLLPFAAGAALAPAFHGSLAGPGAAPLLFALFLGLALAVTAFPVLARILEDRGLDRTPLGALALGGAAANDAAAWCVLALVAGVAGARPGSAAATGAIGTHALFAAFLIGAVVPHDSPRARAIAGRLENSVVVLLLPVFFALSGLRTEVGLLVGARDWLLAGGIVLAASAAKVGGVALARRLSGLAWREAATLGVLMNTRGLMELVVLNVGLDLGLLSPRLFTMLVLMALATTLAPAPLLRLLGPAPARGTGAV